MKQPAQLRLQREPVLNHSVRSASRRTVARGRPLAIRAGSRKKSVHHAVAGAGAADGAAGTAPVYQWLTDEQVLPAEQRLVPE
ncbi:MAG TPA: hypothetical protein VGE72_25045 [Azospirillum sp.]